MIETETSWRWIHRLGLVVLVVVAFSGCQSEDPPVFSVGKQTQALPKLQQDQFKTELERIFGTPTQPAIRKITVAAEGAEAEENVTIENLADPDHLAHGASLYMRRCAGCHGESGDGEGKAAAALFPKPRDYRGGTFKFTSTPFGYKPNRNDIVRVLLAGAKGTSMPSFKLLPDEEIDALTDYVIYLSQRGGVEIMAALAAEFDYEEDEEIAPEEFKIALDATISKWKTEGSQVFQPLSQRPPYDDASIELGRAAFLTKGCAQCHGKDGKGQTEWLSSEFIAAQESLPAAERIKINYDAWGNVAPAADLTARMLHGGRRPIDIYRRIATGINGTPMPAFAQALAEEPDTIWHLVHYVLSIVEGRDTKSADED